MGQKEPEIKPKYIEGASSEIAENRLRLLKTLDILRDETDENNPKTQAQLRKIINKTVYCSPSTMRKILKDIRTYLEDENRSLEVKKSQHRGRLRYRDDDFLYYENTCFGIADYAIVHFIFSVYFICI